MPSTPTLIPVPPTGGRAVTLSASPFWIGSAAGCGLRLYLPGIAERHTAILEREDGFWLAPGPGADAPPTVNGSPVRTELRLAHGDIIELAPAARYRYDSGEPAPPDEVEEEPPEPVFLEAPAPTRRRRRRGLTRTQRRRLRFVILTTLAAIVVIGLAVAAVVLALRAF